MPNKNHNKKICYVSYKKYPYTVLENYSNVLADNGYNITIITRGEQGQARHEQLNNNITVERIFFPANPTTRKSALFYVKKVSAFLKNKDFEVVIIHAGCKYFILIKLLAKTNAKFLFHITSHPVSKKNSFVRFLIYKLIVFLQSLSMNKIIIHSEELKKHWVGLCNLKKTVIIPVGVNMKKVYPIEKQLKIVTHKRLNVPDGASLLVYCGVISPLRRLDLMLRAFSHVVVQKELTRLLIIGSGPSLMEIKNLARDLNINDKIIFTGQITHQDTLNLVAASDVGLSYVPITESYTYNPPLKTFECLAAGLPTVATRTVSNSIIIKHEYNGILAGDQPHQFAEAILRLLNDKELQQRLKANSRQSITEYDYSTIVQNKLTPLIDLVLA